MKIVSNPYKKHNTFYKQEEQADTWTEINYHSNPKSNLITDKITESFFPFKVNDIVAIMHEEYDDGEILEIEFEGTTDEYEELRYLLDDADGQIPENIRLIPSKYSLSNASDVLPKVVKIFDRTIDMIPESVSQKSEILKFQEASSSLIPLVVLGNYSAGKSSFINALIGYDILPNSDSPATAKIIKISQSFDDTASISFEADRVPITIDVKQGLFSIDGEASVTKKLFTDLEEKITRSTDQGLEYYLNAFLAVINDAEVKGLVQDISEVISVSVPFRSGVLSQSNHQFVLFDTPGSNSSSNQDHLAVLKSAMRNMSNGLILFVTEINALDTVDNVKLFDELKSIKEIDSRFSLIVVNKADSADFSDFDSQAILQQAIPKKLFSEGIFFVSSILGLGAKNNGEFFDSNYDRIYKRSLKEFSNPEAEYYQQLYKHNIVPKQLENRMIAESQSLKEDIVYANSGLYSVEKEIETFATKYSAYNKCQQSKVYLENMMTKTKGQLEQLEKGLSNEIEELYRLFEKSKKDLISLVFNQKEMAQSHFNGQFLSQLHKKSRDLAVGIDKIELENLCDTYYTSAREGFHLEELKIEIQDAKQKGFSNFNQNWNTMVTSKKWKYVKALFEDSKVDMVSFANEQSDYLEKKKQAFDLVSTQVIETVTERFHLQMVESKSDLYDCSVRFWNQASAEMKKILTNVIGASETLPLEKREDLQELIFGFAPLNLESGQETIFSKDSLIQGIQIGDIKLFQNKNRLDLKKVSREYLFKVTQQLQGFVDIIQTPHQEEFKRWAERLFTIIAENIVDFSPDLKRDNQSIQLKEAEIKDYKMKITQLEASFNEIEHLLSFREVD